MEKTFTKIHAEVRNNLIFHRIVRENQLVDFTDVTETVFNHSIKLLNKQNNKNLKPGLDPRVSRPNVYLTFDDGNQSDYNIVFQRLLDSNIPASFFIVTNWIDKKSFLQRNQIVEMSNAGFIIGSHSVNHDNLSTLSIKDLTESLYRSRCVLEGLIGSPVDSISLPFGSYNSNVINIAISVGYKNIFSSDSGIGRLRSGVLTRNSINKLHTVKSIYKLLYPGRLQLRYWFVRDFLKKSLKNFIGRENYVSIRDYCLK